MPDFSNLQQALRATPYEHIEAVWLDCIELGGDKMVAELCKIDRFFLLTQILNRHDAMHPWIYARCREVEADPDGYLDLWAREHYKDLADDTPMLTANRGWVTHGDLVPGDTVYSDAGIPVPVLAVTKPFIDSECYRVTFDDGAELIAGAGHQWRIRTKHRKRVPGGRKVFWDYELTDTLHLIGRDVGVADVIETGLASLPIDPYVFGCWLGDGHSAGGRFTCAHGDIGVIDLMRSHGAIVKELCGGTDTTGVYSIDAGVQGQKGSGLTGELRRLGVLNNKHIPVTYKCASVSQRVQLLRGLMDTDGHCNTRGTATFCQVSEVLADDVFELATSLALRPRKRHYRNGGRGYFQISFQAHTDRNPFALKRKAQRAIPLSTNRSSRYVRSVDRIASVPTRCIQVSGGMYLAGRNLIPTHNSTIITYAGVIQEIVCSPDITIGIFSFNKPTARKFLRQIKYELETNARLKALFPDIFWANPQKEAPRWSEDGGIVVKRASNPKEATVEGHGLVDGQPTGAHFLLRVYDDVVTLESVSTPEMVKKTTEAWSLSDNLGARAETGLARAWHIGTRYSFRDSYQDMIEMNAVKLRLFAATDNGLIHGNPVFLSPEVWADKKVKQVSSVLAAQMLQNPAAGNQAIFKKEWLRFMDVRPATLNIYILCDPASSRKKGSDRTAIAVVALDAAGNKWLVDGYHHRMQLAERYNSIVGLRKVWMAMPGVQAVEVGYERYGMTSDIEYFEEKMERDKNIFEIKELAWPREGGGSKIDRVQRLEPDFRAGKFFLAAAVTEETSAQKRVRDAGQGFRVFEPTRRRDENGNAYSLNKQMLDEYLVFPFSVHDDFMDATSRIYDIDAVPPIIVDERSLEPETYADGT